MRRLATLLVLLAVLAVACGSDDDGGGGEEERVTITLMTHDSFNVSESVLDAFTEETGITVELLPSGDTGQALNQAILAKGDPLADVFFGVDNTFLTRALDAGIFVPYESPELAAVPDELELDGEHRLTPVDYGDVCVNFDKEFFSADGAPPIPSTLDDLTRPEYEGLLVVEDPSTSSPGLAFLLATVARYGEDGWRDYWSALRANDVQVTAGWEQAYYDSFSGGSGEGDRPLVVSYASSPPAEVVFADPRPAEAPTGVMVDSCFRQVEHVGILAGTRHEDAARRFVDFMLSPELQADVPLNMFVFPVRPDVPLPEEFVRFAAVPDEPLELSPGEIGAARDRWIEEWTATVLR